MADQNGEKPKLSSEQSQVVKDAATLDKVLTAGFLISAAVILIKIFSLTANIKIPGIDLEIPVRHTWLVAILFTVVHWWRAKDLRDSIKILVEKHTTPSERQEVFNEVSRGGGLFFKGMKPRNNMMRILGNNVRKMEAEDRTTGVTLLTAILLIFAIIPFKGINFETLDSTFFIFILIAFVITGINWQIGNLWIADFSELARNPVPDAVSTPSVESSPSKK